MWKVWYFLCDLSLSSTQTGGTSNNQVTMDTLHWKHTFFFPLVLVMLFSFTSLLPCSFSLSLSLSLQGSALSSAACTVAAQTTMSQFPNCQLPWQPGDQKNKNRASYHVQTVVIWSTTRVLSFISTHSTSCLCPSPPGRWPRFLEGGKNVRRVGRNASVCRAEQPAVRARQRNSVRVRLERTEPTGTRAAP